MSTSMSLEPAAKRPRLGSSSSNAAPSQSKNFNNLPIVLISCAINFLDAPGLLACEKTSKNFAKAAAASKKLFKQFDLSSLSVENLAQLFPMHKKSFFLDVTGIRISFNFFSFLLKERTAAVQEVVKTRLEAMLCNIPHHCPKVAHLYIEMDAQSYCERMLKVWGKSLKTLEFQGLPTTLPYEPPFPDFTSHYFLLSLQGYFDAKERLPQKLAELRQIFPKLEQYTVQGNILPLPVPATPATAPKA